MGWIIFFASALLVFLLVRPYKKWSKVWYAGVIAMVIIYVIDSTFISLGAFSYQFANFWVGKIPILYWLSSFFGGIIYINYLPQRKVLQFPYILLSSFLFLILELLMYLFRHIVYQNWNPINSYFLDVFGFIVVAWLWNWVSEVRKE